MVTKQKQTYLPKNRPKRFCLHGCFCRNFLKNVYMPTSLLKLDALLLVTHWSDTQVPRLISQPLLQLTTPKLFSCREKAEKNSKKISCRGQVVYFSTSLGSRWLNTVPLPSDRWNKNHKVFSFLPTLFVLHR